MSEVNTAGISGIDLNKIGAALPGKDPNKDKILEVYRLLKRYKEDPDRQDWEKEVYKRCWQVAWGKNDAIWSEQEIKAMTDKKQIPVAVNDIAKGIQGSAAVATANKPGINVKPVGSADLYVAELLKRGFDYVWGQNEGGMELFDFVKECKTGSIGALEARFDATKGAYGKIVFVSDNPLDYFWDKKSRRPGKTDSHIIKAHRVSKEYAKEEYGLTDDDLDFNPVGEDEEEGFSTAGKPGEDEYARMKSEKESGTGTDEKEDLPADVWEIEAWLLKKINMFSLIVYNPATNEVARFSYENKAVMVDMANRFKALKLVVQEKEGKVECREQRVIVGKKLVSSAINPLGLDSDGDPVMPKIIIGHDRSWTGFFTSPAYRAVEISKSRNKRRSQAIYAVSKSIDAPIMRPAGTKWVNDQIHGDELEVPKDAAFPPARLLPGTIASEVMAMEQRDALAIDEEFDMHDVMKGKVPPGDPSGRTILALQDQAGTMSTPFVALVESSIVKLAKVIFALMIRHWSRQMWERLIDEEEMKSWQPDKDRKIDPMTGEAQKPEPDEVQMKWQQALERISPSQEGANPITLEGLDVKFIGGSTLPTNRMMKRMDAADMVKSGVYDAEAALEYIDDPMKDKVAARMKQKEQMLMQMNMMKGMGKQ